MSKIKIAFFPRVDQLTQENPYWRLLQDGLERLGAVFDSEHPGYYISYKWLLRNRKEIDILHFHFIQSNYSVEGEHASFKRCVRFGINLLFARIFGYKIVYTLHDLMPTWPLYPHWVEYFARLLMIHFSNCVIVHCHYGKALIKKNFLRKSNLYVVGSPSNFEYYPNSISKVEARKKLQISEHNIVFTFFGGIRPNKGLDVLVNEFMCINDDRYILIIAGRPWQPEAYVQKIKDMAVQDQRIKIFPDEIAESDIQIYLNASDIVVLPFVSILSTTSTLLAMSFKRPVIVPNLGCIPELVDSTFGIIYDRNTKNALREALHDAPNMDLERMGAYAYEKAISYSWDSFINQTYSIYRGLV